MADIYVAGSGQVGWVLSASETAAAQAVAAAASIANFALQIAVVSGPAVVMDDIRPPVYIRDTLTRTAMIAHAGPAAEDIPDGGDLVVRVRRDRGGVITTIGSATIEDGETDSAEVVIAGNFVDGDVLHIDVTEVGLTVPGGNVTLELLV